MLKILYYSLIDISAANGPAVNELTFLTSLLASRSSQVRAVIPEPRHPVGLAQDERVHFIPGAAVDSFSRRLFIRFSGVRALLAQNRAFRPDVWVIRAPVLPVCEAIGVLIASPTCFALKTFSGHPLGFVKAQRGPKRVLGAAVLPPHIFCQWLLARSANVIDVTTDQHACGVRRWYGVPRSRVEVVGNAVDHGPFRSARISHASASRSDEGATRVHVLGYVGRKPVERGGVEVLRAIHSARRRGMAWKGIVVGCAPTEKKHLENLAVKLGIDRHVQVSGVIPYDEVPSLMARLDIGVAFDSAERLAVVGNSNQKVRQYIASGAWVVTAGPGNGFLLDNDVGTLVSGCRTDAILSQMDKIQSEDSSQRSQRIKRSWEVAEHLLSMDSATQRRLKLWQNGTSQNLAPGNSR